ncbi:hypothetical protein [Mycolicibacterium phocaicum]|uniref:hypothetical protein n=1 Tax=Mycolicibacterium phocaicum TaxID=319706 RepID=UPI001CFB4A5C|nr:hypothetical protein [Mycolicibacterium phocaicum]UCZ60235.1 hypothetical protein LHJ73_26885 [Mycolicibacterium phocaicum]
MQLTMKPYITAGVALAGASVIAVAPVVPQTETHLPAVSHVQVSDVHLTALVNPIVALGDIYNALAETVGQTSYMVETSVNPLVRQVVLDANYGLQQGMQLIGNITGATFTLGGALPGTLANVLGNLGTLNVNGAIDSLVGGLLPGGLQLITGINGPVQNILQQPLAVAEAMVPAVLDSVTALVAGLAISTVGIGCGACLGTTPVVQQVVKSVTGILQSVLTLNPGTIYNGVLNNVVSLVQNIQKNVTDFETGTVPYIVNRIITALNVNPNAPGGVTVPVAATTTAALAAAPAAETAKTDSTDAVTTTKKAATATAATSTEAAPSTDAAKDTSTKAADTKAADTKAADTKAADTKAATETAATDTKTADAKDADAKGATKDADTKATDTKGATKDADTVTTPKDAGTKTKKAQNPVSKVAKSIAKAIKGAAPKAPKGKTASK